ncbi:hypothetical protein TGAM01_v211084 [Trichoderma gamsii]|uniref:Ecp2 effector protein domain-containing protein n=1 Tax=Trichoderma gamsii TaxID=398673 RepID=A0A2P4Z6Y4_9HYPO|nr:hypothetical protein TGAM01_v211084 [Trichoderma gamsii]PON20040.1 hypothetical protein TGAM01_v211084 [Trichoderma gamsii]
MSKLLPAIFAILTVASAATVQETQLGTFGDKGKLYIKPAPPPAAYVNGTHTNSVLREDFSVTNFQCVPPGSNGPASGDDCAEIYRELLNISGQSYTIPPLEILTFEYISCAVGILNRDVCGDIHFTAGELAPFVNTMLQCPYNYGADGVIEGEDPPVMIVMTGLDEDLPSYTADGNCNDAHDELKRSQA